MEEEKKINLKLTDSQVSIILECLGCQPYDKVFGTIEEIRNQYIQQVVPQKEKTPIPPQLVDRKTKKSPTPINNK